jgi:hypothetical protein
MVGGQGQGSRGALRYLLQQRGYVYVGHMQPSKAIGFSEGNKDRLPPSYLISHRKRQWGWVPPKPPLTYLGWVRGQGLALVLDEVGWRCSWWGRRRPWQCHTDPPWTGPGHGAECIPSHPSLQGSSSTAGQGSGQKGKEGISTNRAYRAAEVTT